ncbi:class I SAM-dependent methyltransferase [Asticcacaulis sp. AC460]|uniref:class I SAM-dependent methyltransferase n=1 Tax=Asticcacaulis sp. AC460 TaxID=1282360 RepID=UPI0009DDA029|nr:class I SAM-dependent methyltransferase [Asticcacaulis sp. AC460]
MISSEIMSDPLAGALPIFETNYAGAAVWDAEYRSENTIPSSRRRAPAKALVSLGEVLQFSGKRVLDIGCGNGRNANYLASMGCHVVGIDFSEEGLKLAGMDSATNVEYFKHDFLNGVPFEDGAFDLILDSYAICHVVDIKKLSSLKRECYRLLKANGLLLKIHLDDRDLYYRQRAIREDDFGYVSFDSVNSIQKRHFSLDSYLKFMSDLFQAYCSRQIIFSDNVRGDIYERSVFACAIKKVDLND